MFSCFTVKNKNEKKLQKPPNALSTESPLESQIDAIRCLSQLWSMGSQIPEEGTNDLGHTVAPANPADSYPDYFNPSIKNHDYVIAPSNPECTTPGDDCPCHFKSNRSRSPQQSSVTQSDELATVSTKIWNEQPIEGHDYVNMTATPGNSSQIHAKSNRSHSRQKSSVTRPDKLVAASTKPWGDQILEGHDYVNMTATPGNSSQIHAKSNRSHSRQKSSVTRPDKLVAASIKPWGDQILEGHDYVTMTATPGNSSQIHSTLNGARSQQKASDTISGKSLDEIIVESEKIFEELDKCYWLLQGNHSFSNHQSPTLPSVNKTQPSQKPNAATEIDKKINPMSPTTGRINHDELMRALQKQRAKIDTNDPDQKIANPLLHQMTAMEANRPLDAGASNIKPYHGSKKKWAAVVAGNRNN